MMSYAEHNRKYKADKWRAFNRRETDRWQRRAQVIVGALAAVCVLSTVIAQAWIKLHK